MDTNPNRHGAEGHSCSAGSEAVCFAGASIDKWRHVCAFFHSLDEEYEVLIPFIKEGIQRNEKVLSIVDPTLRSDHCARLSSAGIDVRAMEQRRQLELRDWNDTYLKDGHFDQEKMFALLRSSFERGPSEGFALTRVTAHAEWAVGPEEDSFLKYEAKLNNILPLQRNPVICLYDLRKFVAGYAIDVLRTHPLVVIGGILQENPFYVPPDEFLKRLHHRQANQKTAKTFSV